MPRKLRFNKNSVLYFRWDQAHDIYLISDGSVVLSGDGTVSDANVRYGKGDFVGLYAALGNFPYQEDAITETEVEVVLFSVEEFELLISNKTNLSLQLLQMLSKELRSTHIKAKKILSDMSERVDTVQGLYSYAKLYLDNKEFDKAKYVIETFLRLYPNSSKADEVRQMLKEIDV